MRDPSSIYYPRQISSVRTHGADHSAYLMHHLYQTRHEALHFTFTHHVVLFQFGWREVEVRNASDKPGTYLKWSDFACHPRSLPRNENMLTKKYWGLLRNARHPSI
jgi:hypothetical protein